MKYIRRTFFEVNDFIDSLDKWRVKPPTVLCPSAPLREIRVPFWVIIILLPILTLNFSCHIYSLTGASIEGKTINVHQLKNHAALVVPTLSATLTQKIRQRILSQSSLAQVNSDQADYVMEGNITNYDVSVASISGTSTTDKSRLTITVQIDFKNNKNEKGHFSQIFSRFADFNASQSLQSVESTLINSIADQLADDIFNKAFVNW